ncbi:MAG TPA: enoyl-CoA hydratase-related protein [Candidatus Polarisedimenticolia bacterium]|jgi:2-(1,2-epoxy-1,2-dihydrophenyl)acetyl-CoA isomerase|nr:enoyl-CoA hydratase-related protein [Candidatus Polarisedimenticolia bacterium]
MKTKAGRGAGRRARGQGGRRSASAARPSETVVYRVEEGVAWLTLNRPERSNALSGRMREDLLEKILEAGGAADVRCLVLTGAGDSFCAGGDLSVMAAMKEEGEGFEGLGRLMEIGGRIAAALAALPKPSLASLPGAAAGAGCNLALACDFRLAAASASLGETFARIGLHPDWGGTYFLPRLVGAGRALDLCATGRMVAAAEALAIGLVTRVVPREELAAETRAFARQLATLPRRSFLAAREALRRSLTSSLPAMLLFERQAQELCWGSPDSAEGIRAFQEKRPPRFSDR